MRVMNNKMTKIFLSIFTIVLLVGCTSRKGPPASVYYDKKNTPYHFVKKGDSIASIARKYGMSKRALIKMNDLEPPYRIVKGQRLLVQPHDVETEDGSLEEPAQDGAENDSEDGVHLKPLLPLSPEKSQDEITDETGADVEGANSFNQDIPQRTVDRPSKLPETPPAADNFIWPVKGNVVRDFNPASSGKVMEKGKIQNDGINIAAPKGTSVVAANNGVVAHVGNQLRGFGNVVLIKHDENKTMTVYAHLDTISVKKADVVQVGQKVGTVGDSGTASEPQLHFEIRKGKKPIDPNQYLR